MINREILYKRDMNNSYMIIPAMSEYSFDEGQLMEKSIEHLLPVEKCYVATMGQYWYDITGKQALDSYCRLHSIGKDFFQVLVLKLCQLVESLEWQLIDVNCVVLDPEMIFVNGYDEEVMFVAYPFHKGNLASEMQQLMEYLLTKLDHSDTSAIGWAYQLYEMTLRDGVSITAIKNAILEERAKKRVPLEQKPEELFAREISLQPEVEAETFLSSQEENFLNVPVK